MAEMVKLSGSVGRGKHYLKRLLNPDGSPSHAYKLVTELNYFTTYGERRINDLSIPIISIMPAGGPLIKVGEYLTDVDAFVELIQIVPKYGPVVLVKQ